MTTVGRDCRVVGITPSYDYMQLSVGLALEGPWTEERHPMDHTLQAAEPAAANAIAAMILVLVLELAWFLF